jgi:hypothetical protein
MGIKITEQNESFWGTPRHKADCDGNDCHGCDPGYLQNLRNYFLSMEYWHTSQCLRNFLDSDLDLNECLGCSISYLEEREYRKARRLAITSGQVKEVIKEVYVEVNKAKNVHAVCEIAATPIYPMHVWDGTVYKDYADAVGAGNYIPREFFVEALKTVTGAVVGNNLKCSKYEVNPRFYTVLLAPSQGGKGTAIGWAQEFYKNVQSRGGAYFGPLLWGLHEEIDSGSIGAAKCEFASDVGMMEWASAQPRWLQVYEELNTFMEKAGIQGSGQSLLALNRTLYDTEECDVSAKAKRKGGTFKVLNSFLAGTTPKLWADMFQGTHSVGSGLFQRFSITAHDGDFERVGALGVPSCRPLVDHLIQKVRELETTPLDFYMTPEALEEMNAWFKRLQETMDKEDSGRINSIANKNALHLAWLRNDKPKIEGADMRGGIALADYHLAMRKIYKPNTGENIQAILQEKIIKALQTQQMTKSTTMDKTHAYRYGTEIAKRAWDGLVGAGLITCLADKKTFRPTTTLERENEHLREVSK